MFWVDTEREKDRPITFHTLTRQKKRLAVPRAFPGTFWIPPKSISAASWIFSRCLQDAPRSSNCTLNNHDQNKHLFGIISCALRLLNVVWCSTLLTKAPLLGSALALSISYFKIHQIIFVVLGHRLILAWCPYGARANADDSCFLVVWAFASRMGRLLKREIVCCQSIGW